MRMLLLMMDGRLIKSESDDAEATSRERERDRSIPFAPRSPTHLQTPTIPTIPTTPTIPRTPHTHASYPCLTMDLVLSMDVLASVPLMLQVANALHDRPELQQPDNIIKAFGRYHKYLDLVVEHMTSPASDVFSWLPPIDVQMIWNAHLTRYNKYQSVRTRCITHLRAKLMIAH